MQVEVVVLRPLQLAAEFGEHLQRLQRRVDSLERSANVTLADGCGATRGTRLRDWRELIDDSMSPVAGTGAGPQSIGIEIRSKV